MNNSPTNHSLKCLWNAKAPELKSKDPHSLPPISVPTIIMMEEVLPEDLLRLWKHPPSLMKTSSTWFRDCNLEDWKINEPLYLKTEKRYSDDEEKMTTSIIIVFDYKEKNHISMTSFILMHFIEFYICEQNTKGVLFQIWGLLFLFQVCWLLDIDSTIAHKLWLPSRKVAS